MKLAAICLGRPEVLVGKSYRTGINKVAFNTPVIVDTAGLAGDAVCNRKHHGGPDQAILLEGSVTLDWWMRELGRDLPPGSFGENIVIEGLDNRDVCVGDRF
ncbi:MAG TPA: MOSC domain-containing protein, partial [Pseudorhizobium sp.]|nr:MOSC domain-containing protein [Pseudorhizobium sp.]